MFRSLDYYICNSTSVHLGLRTQLDFESFVTFWIYMNIRSNHMCTYIYIKSETATPLVLKVIIRVSDRCE